MDSKVEIYQIIFKGKRKKGKKLLLFQYLIILFIFSTPFSCFNENRGQDSFKFF